jgi:hypothetical protein
MENMRSKQAGLASFVVLAILCGTLLSSGWCFSTTPTCIDPGGDQESAPGFADILKVWVDNDGTFLRFKLELNGTYDQYYWPYHTAYISVDNSTGVDYGWDVLIDYRIDVYAGPSYGPTIYFENFGNSTNNLDDTIPKAMSYYSLTDNNHTLEFGYRLHTYYNDAGADRGFLNVSIGQTIYLRMRGDWDSDYAPDEDLPSIRYVVKESGGIPGFGLLLLTFAMLTVFAIKLGTPKKASS